MTTPQREPNDAMSEAYEKMLKLATGHFQHTEEKSLQLLHHLADNASNEFRESLERLATRHTGEITAPGILTCDQYGELLHFHRISKVPPCSKCHGTAFHRQSH